jgi:protein O-mannosyl-transferase
LKQARLGLNPSFAWLPPLVAVVVTALAFWPVVTFSFVNWDDDKLLLANPFFRGLAWQNLRWMLTSFRTGPYQPLSWLSYALDFTLWGMDPRGYHLTNLILHAVNAGLMAALSLRLLRKALPSESGRSQAAVLAAALISALVFATHPLRAESVAWVTERRDVLAGLFTLATLIFYCDERPRLALAAYALSLLSKGMGVSLPFLLLVLDWWPLKRSQGSKVPFFLLAAAAGAVGVWGQSATGSLELVPLSPGIRLLQALWAGWFYFAKTLWPTGLMPAREVMDYQALGRLGPGAAAFVAATAAAWFWRKRAPGFAAAWTAHVLAFLPVSGLWRFGPLIAADRYSYFICLPWAVMAGGLWLMVWDKARGAWREAWAAAVLGLLLVLAGFGRVQALTWEDSGSLWRHALAVDPGNAAAHNDLGVFYLDQRRYAEALDELTQAVAARPGNADAHNNRAGALDALGRDEEAALELRAAIELRPHPGYWVNLGMIYSRLGRLGQAQAAYEAALRLQPGYEPALRGLEACARLTRPAQR